MFGKSQFKILDTLTKQIPSSQSSDFAANDQNIWVYHMQNDSRTNSKAEQIKYLLDLEEQQQIPNTQMSELPTQQQEIIPEQRYEEQIVLQPSGLPTAQPQLPNVETQNQSSPQFQSESQPQYQPQAQYASRPESNNSTQGSKRRSPCEYKCSEKCNLGNCSKNAQSQNPQPICKKQCMGACTKAICPQYVTSPTTELPQIDQLPIYNEMSMRATEQENKLRNLSKGTITDNLATDQFVCKIPETNAVISKPYYCAPPVKLNPMKCPHCCKTLYLPQPVEPHNEIQYNKHSRCHLRTCPGLINCNKQAVALPIDIGEGCEPPRLYQVSSCSHCRNMPTKSTNIVCKPGFLDQIPDPGGAQGVYLPMTYVKTINATQCPCKKQSLPQQQYPCDQQQQYPCDQQQQQQYPCDQQQQQQQQYPPQQYQTQQYQPQQCSPQQFQPLQCTPQQQCSPQQFQPQPCTPQQFQTQKCSPQQCSPQQFQPQQYQQQQQQQTQLQTCAEQVQKPIQNLYQGPMREKSSQTAFEKSSEFDPCPCSRKKRKNRAKHHISNLMTKEIRSQTLFLAQTANVLKKSKKREKFQDCSSDISTNKDNKLSSKEAFIQALRKLTILSRKLLEHFEGSCCLSEAENKEKMKYVQNTQTFKLILPCKMIGGNRRNISEKFSESSQTIFLAPLGNSMMLTTQTSKMKRWHDE